jgi:hypothetical protein
VLIRVCKKNISTSICKWVKGTDNSY